MRRLFHVLIIVGCVAALSHVSYVTDAYLWLDHGDIHHGRAVVPLSQIASAMVERYGETGYYRPIITLVHSIEADVFGTWMKGFHIVRIILHAIVSMVSVVAFKRVLQIQNRLILLIAGSLVAVHPAGWFTVGMLATLPEILMMIFLLIMLIAYDAIRHGGYAWISGIKGVAITVAAAACALFSKETALVLVPGSIVVYELTSARNKKKPHDYSLWVWIASVMATYAVLRFFAVPEVWRSSVSDMSINEYMGTRLSVVFKTLASLVSLTPVYVSDATRIVPLTPASVLTAALLCATVLYMVMKAGLHHPLTRSLALVVLFVFPVLNILPLPRFWSPNYIYGIVVCFSGVVAVLLSMLIENTGKQVKIVMYTCMFIIIACMGLTTVNAGKRFSSDYTFFYPEVLHDPLFREGHFYVGMWFADHGDTAQAELHLTQAVEKHDGVLSFVDEHAATINLAGIYTKRGAYEKAVPLLLSVYESHDPLYARIAFSNIAHVYELSGDSSSLVDLFSSNPDTVDHPDFTRIYIKHLLLLKKFDEAEHVLDSQTVLSQEDVISLQSLIRAGRNR